MFLWHFIYALSDASVGRTLSPGSSLKPVAAPAAHSVMKGSAGTVLHDQDIATAANNAAAEQYLTPNYTVQSPYSTINVSENQFYFTYENDFNVKTLLILRYTSSKFAL